MNRLPYSVRHMVGAGGGGVRGFGEGPPYILGGEGRIVLIRSEAEERGRWGFFEGKKCPRSVSATSARSEVPGRSRNLCGGRRNANLLAVQRDRGVSEDRKSDQGAFLANAMALKYVLLELLTLLQLRGEESRRDVLANL